MGWDAATRGAGRRIEPRAFTKVSALGEGYRLDAHIRVYEKNDALRVPTGALFRRGNAWRIFIVGADDRAHETTVKVGHRNEEFAEPLSGVQVNDRVILYPSDALKEGARVKSAVTKSAATDT